MSYHVFFTRTIKRQLEKVYSWCTDIEPQDVRLWRNVKKIRILNKDNLGVTYECELNDDSRFTVVAKLYPPDWWEATYEGQDFHEQVSYKLEAIDGSSTRFTYSAYVNYRGKYSSWTHEDARREREGFWDRAIVTLENEVP